MVKTKKSKKEIVVSGDEMSNENDHQPNFIDSDADDVNVKNKKNKMKNKKNLKKQISSSIDSDNEDDDKSSNLTSGTKGSNTVKGKKGKNGKKNKNNDADEDDIDIDDGDNLSKKDKKSKKQTVKKSGFDSLMPDDDDNDDIGGGGGNVANTEVIDPDNDYDETKISKKNEKSGKKGKKAKRKNKDDDDDEDLDKILAELQAEYTGEKQSTTVSAPGQTLDDLNNEKNSKKKKVKNTGKLKPKINVDDDNLKAVSLDILLDEALVIDDDEYSGEEESGTVKTAAQKKKEKKERQKREAALAKQKAANDVKNKIENVEMKPSQPTQSTPLPSQLLTTKIEETISIGVDVTQQENDNEIEVDEKPKKDKKKGKKDKKTDEEDAKKDTKKKGISASMVAAMQERLKKIKEEEERQQKEEEERIRQEEERERARLEAIRIETERKEKKKQKEAERKARLKAEGKLLTKKQKEDRARAQAMLDALKAQGLEIPDPNEKRSIRPGTRMRLNKKKTSTITTTTTSNLTNQNSSEQPQQMNSIELEKPDEEEEREEIKIESIKESWDLSDSDDQNENNQITQSKIKENLKLNSKKQQQQQKQTEESDDSDEDENSDEIADDDDDGDGDDDEDDANVADVNSNNLEHSDLESNISEIDNINEIKHDNRTDNEIKRERAISRIEKRKIDAEKKRTTDDLRAAVVCVLGHVDTGKTKILDKLRRTNVQDCEAGGITQQIGATNVPIDAIKEQSKYVKNSNEFIHRLPGLLIIDTPGHESFSNLRNRGSSLCDIAILVVDIMHGLEPQTIESINLLKKKKCPFIVALNKIDRLYDWKVLLRRDIRDVIKEQQTNTQLEFNQRTKNIIIQFAEQGLNAALFYNNPDPKTYVSLVPTSAITGDGMGNLLFLIMEYCQKMLSKRLMYSNELQATVLEVKAIPGLGTTIDIILINGKLREGDTIIIAGTDGPITTQIRSLLMPQPLKELRVKNAYVEYKEIKAAQGVKIAAKDLEKAIAGINLLVANKPDEIELCREEVAHELKNALSHIKLATIGVYVQASTLGSLEALLEFLRQSKIPYSAIRIGPVVKRDVMKASIMLEHEAQYATILAFDVKVERDAQEMADSLGVKIFQADIIYHLFDKFMAYREELKQKKRDEFKSIAVFPCKLKILPQFIFNSRDPIVMGVMVENGIVKVGTPLCVPSKEFVDIGIVTSIESNHKNIESARKGQEICVKIEPIPGESPKMYGRHFESDDMLVSKISRQSIDACKDYFRDDLIKADWSLMVELKKLFQIM